MQGLINKEIEKYLLRAGAIWNLFTGVVTMVYYSSWLKKTLLFGSLETDHTSMADKLNYESVYSFVTAYSLVFLLFGIIHLFLSIRMKSYNNKTFIWLCIWVLLEFLTVDIIGVMFYLPAAVVYLLKHRVSEKVKYRSPHQIR